MPNTIADDPRIDPRLKAMFGSFVTPQIPDMPNREVLLQIVASLPRDKALGFLPTDQDAALERIAPSAGLSFARHRIASAPDGNEINLHLITPEQGGPHPTVFYIHGGGMMLCSCFDANYQAWGRLIAAQGVAVAMVDFRNALYPSSVPEVAAYPAGLNDCVSALRWVIAQAGILNLDPSRLIVAGESGGANLAIATLLSLEPAELAGITGLYVLCPYLAGAWPSAPGTSALENQGILMDLSSNYGTVAYGIEAYEARDARAWPGFATAADVAAFPPTVIAVNECDVLRDDGIAFYHLLQQAGVPARCRQAMGTIHGTEVFVLPCPDVSRDAARDIAAHARQGKA